VLPATEVRFINAATGVQRITATNESGVYFIPYLQPGTYRMVVRRRGFMAATRSDIQVSVDQDLHLDVTMYVAPVAESVSVRTELLTGQASAELGTVIGRRAVESLPLNGRNYSLLLMLAPGATPVSTAQGSQVGSGDGYPTGIPGTDYLKPSIQGQQNRAQLVYVDGIINTDFRSHSYAILPNLDLVQEFKLQSHNDKVEWGGTAGGVVSIASRSGTNDLHGSAFWFVRNNAFDARDPFKDAVRDSPAPFRQNQFGAALAGPIVRNRTFFSGGYDAWRYRKPSQSFARVPTTEELAGDFSQSVLRRNIYNPYTTRRAQDGSLVRDPFPGNAIPSSLISPMARGLLETYEERPNLVHPVYNFINALSSRDTADGFQIKLDHEVSRSSSAFFLWSRQHRNTLTPTGVKKTTATTMAADNYGGGWLHVLNPNLIVSARAGVARRDFLENLDRHAAGLGPMRLLGFREVDRFGGFLMRLESPWRDDIGVRGPGVRENPTFSGAADLTWVAGNHTWKTGFQWIRVGRLQLNTHRRFWNADQVTSDPQQPGKTGASLASALLGLPVSFEGYLPNEGAVDFSVETWSSYVQDSWRAAADLTVNYGLRFDHTTPPSVRQGFVAGPDLDRGLWVTGARELPPPCNIAGRSPCIPGNGLSDVLYGDRIVASGTAIPAPVWDNWGPRAGLAYRLNAGTVIRGGYGLYWDTLVSISQATQHNLEGRWPSTFGFSGVANQLGAPLTPLETLQRSLTSGLPEPTPWNFQGWINDPRRKNGWSQQWNVELQRQVTENLLASVAYVGSVTGRLEYSGLGNSARQPGRGTPEQVNQRRPVPYLSGGMLYSRSIGEGNYHSLQAKLHRTFARGLETMLSYTWSKSIDTGASGWFGVENGPGGSSATQNYHDPQSNRSVSSYDVPHFLSWFSVYEVPLGRGRFWGNWQVNSVLQWRSGQPYNLRLAGDVANIGNQRANWHYARPTLVGDPRPAHPTVDRYYNPEAFAIPQFEYGNFGRNVLRSDRVLNLDLSVFRVIPLGADDARRLEVRIEAFNALNHIDWAPPGNLIGQVSAGRVAETAHPPRIVQFGLRLVM
jgi:hypothetical protein